MVKELELFSLDGASGWFRRTKPHEFHLEPGQKCANCDTELHGRYCSQCGQNADTHHRTIGHLLFEAFEGLFHLDGRIWQTLPPLFLNPGKLARDLMEGRVARHVPPFRIFLVALLVFMFVAERKTEDLRHQVHVSTITQHENAVQAVSPAAVSASSDSSDVAEDPLVKGLGVMAEHQGTVTTVVHPDGSRDVTRQVNLFAMSEEDGKMMASMVKNSGIRPQWLKDDLYKALTNPESFFRAMFAWGHRLALLLLPILGLFLGMLFSGKKYQHRFYLYDHLLVAKNLLSFIFLVEALGLLLPDAIMAPWGKMLGFVWIIVNFYQTLRGAYGSSVIGAICKSLILWILSVISFSILLTAVMFVSLATS